ncbi:MAG: MFS transporter [Leptospiraceae bacterium]|nr:MFS transporter [Leptospiraceae bacterium]
MNKNLFLIFLSQSCIQVGNIFLASMGTIIGLELSKDVSLSTIPMFCSVASSLLIMFPSTSLMATYGRKPIFLIGIIFGLLGIFICILSIYYSHFILFCVGTSFIGCLNSISNFFRYAAIEVSHHNYRSKAVSFVMLAGVIAAIVGPNLYSWGSRLPISYEFIGGFLILGTFYLLGIFFLSFVHFVSLSSTSNTQSIPFTSLLSDSKILSIMILSIIITSVMIFIMSATPLGMKSHHFSNTDVANIIRLHVLGMFVPSFFTGDLIKFFGRRTIMLLGTLFYFICIGTNFLDSKYYSFVLSLVLLGIGWNFLFVGNTLLLTEKIKHDKLLKSQSLNEFLIALFSAVSIFVTGRIHESFGYSKLNLIMIPFVFLCIYLIFTLHKVSIDSNE